MLRAVVRSGVQHRLLRWVNTAANAAAGAAPHIAPRSLGLPPDSPSRYDDPPRSGFKGTMLRLLGFYGKESTCIRGGNVLYRQIKSLVDSPQLYSDFGMEKKFRTVHSMLVLHIWMCLRRVRSDPSMSQVGQTIYDILNQDLEFRMRDEGLKIAVLRSRWMRELERAFYGAVTAYDNAMQPTADPDDLARSLWKNVIAEDDSPMPTSGPDYDNAKALADYVRTELANLAMTESEDFFKGNIRFSKQPRD